MFGESAVGHQANSCNRTCVDFNSEVIDAVRIARPTIASIGAVLCILVIVVVTCILREYRKFAYRLVLYLMSATFFVSVSQALAVAPLIHTYELVEVRNGWNGTCMFTGWLIQFSAWIEHMMIGWISLYLLLVLVLYPLVRGRPYKYCYWHEIAGLTCTLAIPFVVSLIPFIHGMYGLSGLWCWIEVIGECCKTQYKSGIGFMFGLYYGPFIVIILFSALVFLVIMLSVCGVTRQHRGADEQEGEKHQPTKAQQTVIREVLPLLLYPLIYDLLFVFQVTNRVYYSVSTLTHGSSPLNALWMAHIIVDSGRCLYPPLAFLLHPSSLRRIFCRERRAEPHERTVNPTDQYVVANEFSTDSQEPLVYGGNSNPVRRQRLEELSILSDYQSILQ